MQYSYYGTSSMRHLNLLFVKNGDIILINGEYKEYCEEYLVNDYKRSIYMIITEDTLKKIESYGYIIYIVFY
jgi:hypothetical protein